ncbi:hypothetical protein [Variovorax sp. 770b2]|uniref:hypothetical protein n=1 Tax=Variovorax sp. 770b2 TaxID=1566271 RepID=UPI00116089D4|nr:hypothetical protein [Variovorax sp. 770b2]
MPASVTHRTRWLLWLGTVLVVALAAPWWWPSSDDAVVPVPTAPTPPIASAPAPAIAPMPMPQAAKPLDAARSTSALKLVGTVVAADGVDSFALMRRTADAQLVQLRVGAHVEGLTVSAIGADSVVLAGAGQAIVIEADRTVAVPAPSPAPPHAPDVEPAWAGDPAPFGH